MMTKIDQRGTCALTRYGYWVVFFSSVLMTPSPAVLAQHDALPESLNSMIMEKISGTSAAERKMIGNWTEAKKLSEFFCQESALMELGKTYPGADRVHVQSQGAVMGDMIGGVTSGHHHRTKHAVEGAIARALLMALLEGNKKAYQYTVEFTNGSQTKIVTETGGIVEDDCVSVELGQTANIRRVSSVYCDHYGHDALREPIVHAKRQSEAAAPGTLF